MANPKLSLEFARKLKRLAPLSDEDLGVLAALPMQVEQVPRFRQLVREGDVPDRCCLLLKGFAGRYKVTANGAKQIVSFHVAGDLLDVQHLLLARADHFVEAITA